MKRVQLHLYSPFVTWESRIFTFTFTCHEFAAVWCTKFVAAILRRRKQEFHPKLIFAAVSTARQCAAGTCLYSCRGQGHSANVLRNPTAITSTTTLQRQPDIIFAIRSTVPRILARKFALGDLDHLPTILIRWQERDDVIVRCITPLPGVNVLERRQVRE